MPRLERITRSGSPDHNVAISLRVSEVERCTVGEDCLGKLSLTIAIHMTMISFEILKQ